MSRFVCMIFVSTIWLYGVCVHDFRIQPFIPDYFNRCFSTGKEAYTICQARGVDIIAQVCLRWVAREALEYYLGGLFGVGFGIGVGGGIGVAADSVDGVGVGGGVDAGGDKRPIATAPVPAPVVTTDKAMTNVLTSTCLLYTSPSPRD